MNILSANAVSSRAKTGSVIGNLSHAGASGGQFVLDAEAQVFFSVNAKNQLGLEPGGGHFDNPRLLSDHCVGNLLGVRCGRLPVNNPGHDISMSRLVHCRPRVSRLLQPTDESCCILAVKAAKCYFFLLNL
jgi:hypothetical protein